MQPEGHERRKEHSPDEELQGLAMRSLHEGVPVDELKLRLRNLDGSAGPDAGRVDELCAGAKEKLLAVAGHTTREQAAAELKPAATAAEAPALASVSEPAPAQAPEKVLTAEQQASLLAKLEARFASDAERFKDIPWASVKAALEAAGDKALYGLFQMEENGHAVGVTRAEKGGRKGFRFDSWSKESPKKIRNVNYFEAEEIAEKNWGVSLMSREVFEELRTAGIITNRNTWDYLKTEDPRASEKFGLAWYGDDRTIGKRDARNHSGFRCSLWVPEA